MPAIGLIIIGDEILSGKRQDRHLANANALLQPRGLAISWVQILGDEPQRLQETLRRSFASGDIVFCFGGIGATPDDRTRQCAAAALDLPIERHPEAVKEIEAQFGEDAYPQRVRMAEYPQGADIIPNSFNRVPGFSIKQHHFMPGFPMMAQPMMEWVLDNCYQSLFTERKVEHAVLIMDGQESEWIEFMEKFEPNFPSLRLFSLPKIDDDGRRFIELGVEGQAAEAECGMLEIKAEIERRNMQWEPLY
ncbi:competence/damage-inducible protein A [Thiomicrorhabdus sp. 6S2-11]|uniref:Competence/damage-inducible protein A n=1 Tax=Thiomicrorhabdus marina TaxID=2818442 RepID=A0ABS3Q6X4_9GAMM|nr:competence/damage-inducible protein A [Thiomicrorhabdus marina]MBO1928079.1 competence/damage-inducible protein A [Thiomicrorhabdus marina]